MISLKKILTRLTVATPPCGAISAYYGTTAPRGWLICDGSSFDTNKYSKLYELLGSNTLPDLRGRIIVGHDPGDTSNEKLNFSVFGSLKGSKFLGSHGHSHPNGGHSMLWGAGNVYAPKVVKAGSPGSKNYISTWQHTNAVTNNTGSGDSENIQPSIVLNYIISTGGVV